MRKHFDKELYKKYDTAAKAAAEKLFENSAWTIKISEKKTAVDYQVFEGDKHIAYLEVEVKMNWNVKDFPYTDVQWPERKWKYTQLDKPTIFLMFNHDLSQYLTAPGKALLNSKLEIVRNKYVRYGEQFFKVPVSEVTFNDVHSQIRGLE